MLSLSQCNADAAVPAQTAISGQDQISKPGKSGQRFAFPSAGDGKTSNFNESTGDERSSRIRAQAQSFDDAGGDRNDVFDSRCDFDSDDVRVCIQTKPWRRQFSLQKEP